MPEYEAQNDSTVEYRIVQGFPSYRVGSDGSVWSFFPGSPVDRRFVPRWRPLKATPDRNKYLQVTFKRGIRDKPKTFKVHRLVLEAFIGPCPEGMECRHKDGNRQNNNLNNLAWSTHLENINDKIAHGTIRKGITHPLAKLTDDDVREIRRRFKKEPRYVIAKEKGICNSLVTLVAQRKRWGHVV